MVLAIALSSDAVAAPGVTARCDFDGDGHQDVVVGTPSDSLSGLDSVGAVNVLYGEAGGLRVSSSQAWSQGSEVGNVAEEGDAFGAAVACGDFDADGFDDLAVGAPGEDVGDALAAGAVSVLYGSAAGLSVQRTPAQILTEADLPTGASDVNDQFGAALSVADYDGDGHDDLAIGIPGQAVGERKRVGAVAIVYGSPQQLSVSRATFWHQGTPGVEGAPERGDRLGWTLASGDFDGDGYDDVAAAAPREDVDRTRDCGAVNVLYGSGSGIGASNNQIWSQHEPGVVGTIQADEKFGFALAVGNFDGNAYDDLAIGTPGARVDERRLAGEVNVLYGRSEGLSAKADDGWTQGSRIAGLPESGDRFGASLATGDFDDDGFDDLVVGVPGQSTGRSRATGEVHLVRGSARGLRPAGNTRWHQSSADIEDFVEQADAFGTTVAAGDFDGDGHDDLVVGVPGETIGSIRAAGAVQVLYGSRGSLTAARNQLWSQVAEGTARPNEAMSSPLMSIGVVRIPYADGTKVRVGADHYRHRDHGEIDMWGVGDRRYTLVAPADGTVMAVVDTNQEPTEKNNYLWIAHPNGLWSKHSHVATSSAQVSVGEEVRQGQMIGLEGDVGVTTPDGFDHLHFELGRPDDPTDASTALDKGGYLIGEGLIPRLCGVRGGVYVSGVTYTAAPCPPAR